MVFLISDFLAAGCAARCAIAARRHDLIAVVLDDPRESELPDVGLLELEDAETGEALVVDTGDAHLRARLRRQRAGGAARERDRFLRGARRRRRQGAHRPALHQALLRFFRTRERRR